MFKQITAQATATGLAAIVTLSTLGAMNSMANGIVAANGLAQAGVVSVQQVVIVGQKAPRT